MNPSGGLSEDLVLAGNLFGGRHGPLHLLHLVQEAPVLQRVENKKDETGLRQVGCHLLSVGILPSGQVRFTRIVVDTKDAINLLVVWIIRLLQMRGVARFGFEAVTEWPGAVQ